MMHKEDFIKEIEALIHGEESAIPLYAKYLDNSLFFSDFPEDEAQKLREILVMLNEESNKHRQIFQSLLSHVKESSKDVF